MHVFLSLSLYFQIFSLSQQLLFSIQEITPLAQIFNLLLYIVASSPPPPSLSLWYLLNTHLITSVYLLYQVRVLVHQLETSECRTVPPRLPSVCWWPSSYHWPSAASLATKSSAFVTSTRPTPRQLSPLATRRRHRIPTTGGRRKRRRTTSTLTTPTCTSPRQTLISWCAQISDPRSNLISCPMCSTRHSFLMVAWTLKYWKEELTYSCQ